MSKYVHHYVLVVCDDNPDGDEGMVDSSGFRLHFTTVRRQHESAELSAIRVSRASPTQLSIPAGTRRWFLTTSCIVETKKPITLITASAHAHLLGAEMYLYQTKADETGMYHINRTIHHEQNWHFDDQYNIPLLAQQIVLRNGDRLQSTCIMNATGREKATRFGPETTDEMCFMQATFYPAEGNMVTCKGPRWTGTLDAADRVADIVRQHPPRSSNIYAGRTDLDDGQCGLGHVTLLDPCVVYSRAIKRRTMDVPKVGHCCTMLQLVGEQGCFCNSGFMKAFETIANLTAIASGVCKVQAVCVHKQTSDKGSCTRANLMEMMQLSRSDVGRMEVVDALTAKNPECALCVERCPDITDGELDQGCIRDCAGLGIALGAGAGGDGSTRLGGEEPPASPTPNTAPVSPSPSPPPPPPPPPSSATPPPIPPSSMPTSSLPHTEEISPVGSELRPAVGSTPPNRVEPTPLPPAEPISASAKMRGSLLTAAGGLLCFCLVLV